MLKRKTLLPICLLTVLLGAGLILVADETKTVKTVFAGKLPNVPGHTLTVELVEFSPGYTSEVHHHAGSVFAYVLTGRIRSQNSATGPARIYKAGETFFEPAGSNHLVTENPSASEAARLLAVHVSKDGAAITRPGYAK